METILLRAVNGISNSFARIYIYIYILIPGRMVLIYTGTKSMHVYQLQYDRIDRLPRGYIGY